MFISHFENNITYKLSKWSNMEFQIGVNLFLLYIILYITFKRENKKKTITQSLVYNMISKYSCMMKNR